MNDTPVLEQVSGGYAQASRLIPSFDLRVAEAGRSVMVRVEGPLDVEHAPVLTARLRALCGPGRRMVLDMRRVQFVDSAGVRALLALRADLEGERGELRLVIEPGSRVARTLALLHLQDTFPTYRSASEAWIERRRAA